MDAETYWSGQESGRAPAGLYWSVQRCRWEPVGAQAEALATPWSMFRAAPADLPQQRVDREAPVEA